MNEQRYWHFARLILNNTTMEYEPLLNYGDYRLIVEGETLSVEGRIIPCENGLHGSDRLFDALDHSVNLSVEPMALTQVTLDGDIIHNRNKSVARNRTTLHILTQQQSDKLLTDYALWCANQITHFWPGMPETVKRVLDGDTSMTEEAYHALLRYEHRYNDHSYEMGDEYARRSYATCLNALHALLKENRRGTHSYAWEACYDARAGLQRQQERTIDPRGGHEAYERIERETTTRFANKLEEMALALISEIEKEQELV